MCRFVVSVVLRCRCSIADPAGAVLFVCPCSIARLRGGQECDMTKVTELALAHKGCKLHQRYPSSNTVVWDSREALPDFLAALDGIQIRNNGQPPIGTVPSAEIRRAMDRDVIRSSRVAAAAPHAKSDVEMKDAEGGDVAAEKGRKPAESSSRPAKHMEAPVSRKAKGKAKARAPSSEDEEEEESDTVDDSDDSDDADDVDSDDNADFRSSGLAPTTSPRVLRSRPHAKSSVPVHADDSNDSDDDEASPSPPAGRAPAKPNSAANKSGSGKPTSSKPSTRGRKSGGVTSALDQEYDCTEVRDKVWAHFGGRFLPDATVRLKSVGLCKELDAYRSPDIGCRGAGAFRPRDMTDFLLLTWPNSRTRPVEDPREGESKDIYLALLEWVGRRHEAALRAEREAREDDEDSEEEEEDEGDGEERDNGGHAMEGVVHEGSAEAPVPSDPNLREMSHALEE